MNRKYVTHTKKKILLFYIASKHLMVLVYTHTDYCIMNDIRYNNEAYNTTDYN